LDVGIDLGMVVKIVSLQEEERLHRRRGDTEFVEKRGKERLQRGHNRNLEGSGAGRFRIPGRTNPKCGTAPDSSDEGCG
jgi:hypothetical protein